MSAVMEEKTVRGLREIAVLVFFACGLFFLIALATFSLEDAGWTHSGTTKTIANGCGVFGAWLADVSFSFFGLLAYPFPLAIFWAGYKLHKQREVPRIIPVVLHALGIIATIISAAALLNLYLLRPGIDLPNSTGGIVGQEIGNTLVIKLGNSGATLFLMVGLLGGITLATKVSWLAVLDLIGKYTVMLVKVLLGRIAGTGASDRRFVVREEADDQEESFSLVNIEPVPTSPVKTETETVKKATVKMSPVLEKVLADAQKAVAKQVAKKTPVVRFENLGALPALELLDNRDTRVKGYTQTDLEEMSRLVENILQDFNVNVEVVGFLPGPVITRFELQPAPGVKVSRISSLSKDLARALSVTSVRIVEVIPGKSVIGLEIPNREREMVNLRELLASGAFVKSKSNLTLAMGKDISGAPLVADLGKMPHALVAGTTGSGKSVAINTMILSMLYKSTPEQVRMIMIDPKMLELSVYEGIPHLLTPVVTDMKEASNALRWAVAEMERRYKLMSKMGVRNLAGFNQLVVDAETRGEKIKDPMYQALNPLAEGEEPPVLEMLPSIVIVIDELADMMMIVGKKVEELIARLAQKARAAGIHLILATQRPSVDVLTGLIKANVPTRISFQVSSRIDSRTILDQGGAEALLGNGDMLFLPSGTSIPIRAHGAFVDDHEVHRVVEFLKLTGPTNYLEDITREVSEVGESYGAGSGAGSFGDPEGDALYDQAVQFVTETRKASISSVQRRFKIGYNRAATMIETMEAAGVVSPAESNGSRVVLAPAPVRD
ncbi:DNA translocase FtsK 4TM domain-containing protein [Methylomicrobium sp. Wu6]|uniref:DNA translocase FtsK n=1 Tax=Methylomicrobium sp. Wu6 TaxID=3107928 RepID=UPI002DD67924|nr:DNA translocase FtsK 4TM domain-containing protein [Methylomicrobium sp. Wu6]MEC4750358.1 DNA translocase FtsK 4TM domain-containing protein [Methylomicrobium sp. Wu6]